MDFTDDWSLLDDLSNFIPDDNLDFLKPNAPSFIENLDSELFTNFGGLPDLADYGYTTPFSLPPDISVVEEIVIADHAQINSSKPMSSPSQNDVEATDGTSIWKSVVPTFDHKAKETHKKVQEVVIVFSAKTGKKTVPKRRSAFSEKRKVEVALNRIIGVCVHCKLKKAPCDAGMPCKTCVKRAGCTDLGQRICMRQSLVKARFGLADLFNQSVLETVVKDVTEKASQAPDFWAYICLPSLSEHQHSAMYIRVPVVNFKSSFLDLKRQMIRMNYFGSRMYWIEDTCYAIHPAGVPTADQLADLFLTSWDRQSTPTGPFGVLCDVTQKFATQYCGKDKGLPLQGLMKKCLKLQAFLSMYLMLPHMTTSLDARKHEYCSDTIFSQLRLTILKGATSLEAEILSTLDQALRNGASIGKENPIAIWACLWTLILSYKEHMIFTKALSYIAMIGPRRYDLNLHMYNMLISIYSALFKTTSPLTLDWRTHEVADMLGNDRELIRLFSVIKTELFWFQAVENQLLAEDAIFKTLVLDNELRLMRAHIKEAKRKGIL